MVLFSNSSKSHEAALPRLMQRIGSPDILCITKLFKKIICSFSGANRTHLEIDSSVIGVPNASWIKSCD